jgi:phosphoribosylpyrophosphate synthetase
MISTGKTIVNAVEICRRSASETVRVAVVHGIFSQVVAWNVDITTTNTIDNPFAKVDVAPLIAEKVAEQL